MNDNTQHSQTSLGESQQIACRHSKCVLFDTDLTCFERMAIPKWDGAGGDQTATIDNFVSVQ